MYSTGTGEEDWSEPATCNDESTYGCPALFTKTEFGQYFPFCVFSSHNESRDLISLLYAPDFNTWKRTSSSPPESTAFGVKGTASGANGYISFQKNDGSGLGLVNTLTEFTWSSDESTGQNSADTPTICAYNGVLNVFFGAHNNRDLLWVQKTL